MNLGGALRRILDDCAEVLHLARVSYWELSADHTAMYCRLLYQRDAGTYHEGGELGADDLPAYLGTMRASPSAVVDDAATLHAPVMRRGKLVGVVCHESAEAARVWTLDERGHAREVANAVAAAIEEAERHRAEEAARLASLNTLAAGVAHEINNPLTYINANLVTAMAELEVEPLDRRLLAELLHDAHQGSERVRRIVEDLSYLARARASVLERVDIQALLDVALERVASRLRPRAVVHKDYGPSPRVRIDPARLEQVFSNLLINAIQAIPAADPQQHRIRVVTRTSIDGHAVIEIHDTGCGIAPELLGQIFLPFFTAKPIGVGAGLGLSTSHAIVTEAGGRIDVESRLAGGTTVRVMLPPAPVEAPRNQPQAEGAPRRRVLLVDDEAPIRRILCRMLEPVHDVLVADSGESALAQLRGGAAVDVVLCDLMMPKMTGIELYSHLVAEQPTIAKRTIFMTGGAFSIRSREFLATCDRPLLEKPIDRGMLRRAIASVEL